MPKSVNNNFFVKADKICDYIPVVSSLSNLTDLFQKHVVLPIIRRCRPDLFKRSIHYYSHLNQKSILRCLILLIPVIGNVLVGIYDFAKQKTLNHARDGFEDERTTALAAVKQNGLALQRVSANLQNSLGIVLAAVKQNGLALQYANSDLQNSLEIVLAAVKQNGLALQYANSDLQNSLEIVRAAVKQNGLALRYASDTLKKHYGIVLKALDQNQSAIAFVDKQVREELFIVIAKSNTNQPRRSEY